MLHCCQKKMDSCSWWKLLWTFLWWCGLAGFVLCGWGLVDIVVCYFIWSFLMLIIWVGVVVLVIVCCCLISVPHFVVVLVSWACVFMLWYDAVVSPFIKTVTLFLLGGLIESMKCFNHPFWSVCCIDVVDFMPTQSHFHHLAADLCAVSAPTHISSFDIQFCFNLPLPPSQSHVFFIFGHPIFPVIDSISTVSAPSPSPNPHFTSIP